MAAPAPISIQEPEGDITLRCDSCDRELKLWSDELVREWPQCCESRFMRLIDVRKSIG